MKQTLYQSPTQSGTHADAFLEFNRGIYYIKLLVRLTTAVQQHRGSTMGYLSGEPAFRPRIRKLQNQIDCILELFKELDGEPGSKGTENTLQHIHSDWKTIVLGWRTDQILHNFEFHGHLVNALNRQLKERMRASLQPTLSKWNGPTNALLDSMFVQLPHTIELLATLRGLCTNVTVIRACGTESHDKIAFLLKEIPKEHEQLLQAVDDGNPALKSLKAQRKELHKFLLTIEMKILNNPQVSVDSDFLFQFSSEVIDAHWLSLEQGIHWVEHLGYDLMLEA